MSTGWSITSPLALLGEWQAGTATDRLQDLVLLGFTVNLPFLEKVAIRTARDLGARVTVIGDAAQSHGDPVDVRLRTYYSAWAACQAAFHPKLALLLGEHETTAAIGSGNPTMAGWAHNDELWTVLRGGADLACGGLQQLGDWLHRLPETVSMPSYAVELLRDAAGRLTILPTDSGTIQVLHNLDQGLLAQLPRGPVRELRLYAPFFDQTGRALTEILDWFDPERVVIGLQEHLSSYDGDAIIRATGQRTTEIRFLPERYPRHGKLLEWDDDNGRYTVTGSANVTWSALIGATADGGNCELAVLAPSSSSLMPKGTVVEKARLSGQRTVAAFPSARAVLLLGVLVTRGGLVVTLARSYEIDVTVETSPDGSPGTWAVAGTVPAGHAEAVIAVAGIVGTVVRAVIDDPQRPRAESPPVFAVDPGRCARRREDRRPRLQYSPTEEEIFTDETLAHRFLNDLVHLIEADAQSREAASASSGAGGAAPGTRGSGAAGDRWSAYLDDCERSIGRSLTLSLFGALARMVPGFSQGHGWTIDDGSRIIDDPADEPADEPAELPQAPERIQPSQRTTWRRAMERLVHTITANEPGRAPARSDFKLYSARIFVQLLAHGIWDTDDRSWRELLTVLVMKLEPDPAENAPRQVHQLGWALTALCMGLLRSEASLIGSKPDDLLAARAWRCVRPLVAQAADPALVSDLFIPPVHAGGVVLNESNFEDTVLLAMDDDPVSALASKLASDWGWQLERDGPLYRVTGSFTNPITAAARVATELGQNLGIVLVHASNAGRWAFMAWRRPDLVLASAPSRTWRVYRIDGSFTLAARFTASEGLPTIGLAGRPVPLRNGPPAVLHELLAAVGTDYATLQEVLAAR